MAQLARGTFRTAFFSTDDGAVFLGGSPIGFVILLGDARRAVPVVARACSRRRHRAREGALSKRRSAARRACEEVSAASWP